MFTKTTSSSTSSQTARISAALGARRRQQRERRIARLRLVHELRIRQGARPAAVQAGRPELRVA